MLSVREKKTHKADRTVTSAAVSHLFAGRHAPWLVKDGDSAWYASTVPVGRSCARFAALDITLSVAEREPPAVVAGMTVGSSAMTLGVCGAVTMVGDLGGSPLVCEASIWLWLTEVVGRRDAIVDLAWSIGAGVSIFLYR
jgi:hypothetical protein